MGNYLNVGNDGFSSIRESEYVDKTGLISFINSTLGTPRKLTCVSRPRRFGKSFAAKMLSAYYDRTCDSRHLFEDLEIAKDPSFERHLNRYDVIYLDMTFFISDIGNVKEVVSRLQREVIRELALAYPDAGEEPTLARMLSGIADMTGRRFLFIIDEWDALFREAKEDEGVQKEYIQLLRTLFKSALTDKMIAGAYMTGILPLKKYGTQSAMTDFAEYSMLCPEPLEEYVGFTEEEVRRLCEPAKRQKDAGLGGYKAGEEKTTESSRLKFEDLERWYDGYVLGDTHVYNPKSVMDAIARKRVGNYWTRSETYNSLKIYIDMDFDGLKESVVQMLGGSTCPIDTIAFQNDMTSIQSRDDVLTLLIHLGYLAYDEDNSTVRIPNEEIRREFVSAVKNGSHQEIAKLVKQSDLLLRATLRGDEETVAAAIEQAHSAGTAPLYYNDEQALRSVLRFAYLSCLDEYLRVDELPTGIGYADVVFIPKKGSDKPVLIVELKWNRTADSALQQIKDRKYPQSFESYGSSILLVGISYDEKTKKHSCKIDRIS